MKKIFVFFILFILNSCGYQPIYLNDNLKNIEFFKITSDGDESVNRQIFNFIKIKENKKDKTLNELLVESSYEIQETSKNTKGQVDTYRSKIVVNFEIKKNEKLIKNKTFTEFFDYNNKDTRFELISYQKDMKETLINKISEDIIFFLTYNDN